MRFCYAAVAAVLLLSGCSDEPKKVVKKEPEVLEPLTGRQAFYKMYPSARSWAPDCLPLELKSLQMDQVKAAQGKAGAWQCIFVSPSRGKQKLFTWSAIEAEGNLHKGVFAGLEETYSPTKQREPFVLAAIKTDTDEIMPEALKHSADFLKKRPDAGPLNFILEKTARFPDLAWRVMWGETIGTSEYGVFIDATTGQFLEKAR